MQSLALSIDIGGTNIKYGLISNSGQIIEQHSIITEANLNRQIILNKLKTIILDMTKQAVSTGSILEGIGIGTPGIVDTELKTIVTPSSNFKDWFNINFHHELYDICKIPIYVENDANLAALGEYHFVNDSKKHNSIFITFGTGIGAGIIFNNKIYHGASLTAGEIGHTSIDYKGRQCFCGNRGCWERYASASALKLDYSKEFNSVSNIKQIFEICLKEEPTYRQRSFIDSYFTYVVVGLHNLINTLNPDLIILGGGVMESHPLLLSEIERALRKRLNDHCNQTILIKKAELGNLAALYGAAHLVFNK